MDRNRRKIGNQTYITVGFTDRDIRIIEQTMERLDVDQSTAIRALIRRGNRGPATSPFTPIEGIDTP